MKAKRSQSAAMGDATPSGMPGAGADGIVPDGSSEVESEEGVEAVDATSQFRSSGEVVEDIEDGEMDEDD
jgi:hypothetical protein